MRYVSGMDAVAPPLPPAVWDALPAEGRALILALQTQPRELQARLGQDSSNSSRPPSADPPHAPRKRKR